MGFDRRQIRTWLSYFLLAMAIIIGYKVMMEIDVVFSFVRRFMGIISPFISGCVLAYVLDIPCSSIERLLAKSKLKLGDKGKKILAVICTYLLLVLILFLLLSRVLPAIYQSVNHFIINFRTYYNSVQEFLQYVDNNNILNIDISTENIMATIRSFSLEKLPSSLNALFGVSSALFSSFLTFIASVYVLLEKERFTKYSNRVCKAFIPGSVYTVILKYTRNLNNNLKQYIYTQTLDGCILGVVVTIELLLLGSPYALILGIILGVMNYIPYFGSIVASVIAVIVVAFTQGFSTAGIAAIILLVTQQMDGNVLQPRLMSGSFSLSPLLVIISITIGGAFYNVLGMILAIPIVAVVKDIFEEIIVYYESRHS